MKPFSNFSLSKCLDMFFANFAVFAISFIWARYSQIKLLDSIYIACLATLCTYSILKIRSNNKKIGQLNKSQVAHMQECMNQLMLNLAQDNLEYFYKVFLKKFEDTTMTDDCILIRHNGVSTAIFVEINPDKLTETQVCKCFATANSKTVDKMLILTSTGETQNIKNLVSHLPNLSATIYNDIQVYKMLKAFGSFPDIQLKLKKATKISKLSLIAMAMAPKNAKRYLILSFVFIAYSYFFASTTYYLAFALVALGLALTCKLKLIK